MVSLFDGIGGFPLAFERVGATTVATVEIDKAAAAISARHSAWSVGSAGAFSPGWRASVVSALPNCSRIDSSIA